MEDALERTIKALIDSGGSPWEYNSMDIQILVNWIENNKDKVKCEDVLAEEKVCESCNWDMMREGKCLNCGYKDPNLDSKL